MNQSQTTLHMHSGLFLFDRDHQGLPRAIKRIKKGSDWGGVIPKMVYHLGSMIVCQRLDEKHPESKTAKSDPNRKHTNSRDL